MSAIPLHQWTHGGEKVWLVKCVDQDGTSYDGFRWPTAGVVQCPRALADPVTAREPSCGSGGLFGWPWGLGIGTGREPDYAGRWIVFAAAPSDVVMVYDKAKVVGPAIVLYSGSWHEALAMVRPGAVAWIQHAARGAASATEVSGAASATEVSGAASATGARGAASATGVRGAASATGVRGVAVTTGEESTLEAGPGGICATTADDVTWRVHEDAVLVQRWRDGEAWCGIVIVPRDHGLTTGQVVRVVRGEIQR